MLTSATQGFSGRHHHLRRGRCRCDELIGHLHRWGLIGGRRRLHLLRSELLRLCTTKKCQSNKRIAKPRNESQATKRVGDGRKTYRSSRKQVCLQSRSPHWDLQATKKPNSVSTHRDSRKKGGNQEIEEHASWAPTFTAGTAVVRHVRAVAAGVCRKPREQHS